MGARKIIIVNRGPERLARILRDFGDERVVGILWTSDVVAQVMTACRPFNEPHFVMVNASAESAYRLAVSLMGRGTVLDVHAGVKGAEGKPKILHELDLNGDIHYKLQCFQATHGSSMRSNELARDLIAGGRMPLLDRMTNSSERFPANRLGDALKRASDRDSLKVIVDWE
jgi:threonine dehydrogenase-like Zn-dependent dehydrogenase